MSVFLQVPVSAVCDVCKRMVHGPVISLQITEQDTGVEYQLPFLALGRINPPNGWYGSVKYTFCDRCYANNKSFQHWQPITNSWDVIHEVAE